jgi:ABC-type amino acid transport substrate-binding protein
MPLPIQENSYGWDTAQKRNYRPMIGPQNSPLGGYGLATLCTVIVAAALTAMPAQPPQARGQDSRPSGARELVIGTKVAPPFAIKAKDGTWHGISIDLWRRVANQMHLRYRFQETTLSGLIDGVADHSLDAAVAAVTVSGPRQRVVDFTQPFYNTGLGIAVASDAGITWWPIIRNVFSVGFFRAAVVLFAAALSVGVVLWFIERRHNEHFGAHRHGFGASVLVNERFSSSLRVLDGTFDPQAYAIALPQGSGLRMQINLVLLDAIQSEWWQETLSAYLGPG